MGMILLLAVMICVAIIFIAAFSGFVINDNTDSIGILLFGLIVPASITAHLVDNSLAFVLYGLSYFCGIQVSEVFKAAQNDNNRYK